MVELLLLTLTTAAVAFIPFRTFRRGTVPPLLRVASIVGILATGVSCVAFACRFGRVEGTLVWVTALCAIGCVASLVIPFVRGAKSPRPKYAPAPSDGEQSETTATNPPTMLERIRTFVFVVGALAATLPIAIVLGVLAARFLPAASDVRIAVGYLMPLPTWIVAMCVAFAARRRYVVYVLAALSIVGLVALDCFPAGAQSQITSAL